MSPTSIRAPTATLTRPDFDEVGDVKPKAPLLYKFVVLDWTTEVTSSSMW